MRSFEEALQRWPSSYTTHTPLSELKATLTNERNHAASIEGRRSMYWKLFLLFDDIDGTSWPRRLQSSREAYTSLRNRFLQAVNHPDEVDVFMDPLSEDADSPWDTLRKDEALRREIYQDVDRCMPDNLYFRQPQTQDMLLDILFTWSKLNPDVGYRQGMHEVAAPILWVVERDAIDQSSTTPATNGGPRGESIRLMFDSAFIAHDTFTLFNLVMRNCKSSYEHSSNGPPPKSMAASKQPHIESPMVERCRRIIEVYVAQTDPPLATHLEDIGIIPQVFLLRWIRLLFGREFSFDYTLLLWDRMFAKDQSQDCVDLICVAMILRIRWMLMDADYNTALQLLLKYPEMSSPLEVSSLIDDALYLKSNLTFDGGHHIISKRTEKPPPMTDRPVTPEQSTVSGNAPSFRFSSPARSISRIAQHPAGLEGVLEEAARGIYTRGERWGLNQAVRGVVSEVRKNVQNVQSRTHSRMNSRNLAFGATPADSSREELMDRIEALETRNRALAKMLDGAVGSLWDQNKKAQADTPTEDLKTDELTAAIAKVQFVQIFLADSSLSFPIEDDPERQVKEDGTTSEVTDNELSPFKADLAGTAAGAKSEERPITAPEPQRPTHNNETVASLTDEKPRPDVSETKPRPSLEQSSFSWMLGQEDSKSSSARKAFMSASRFKEGSYRGKSSGKGSTAFLFGEEEEDLFGSTSKPKEKDKAKADADESDRMFRLGTLKGKADDA